MATSTYTQIATTTLTSTSSTVTFSSIPGTYTDLVLITTGGTTANDSSIMLTFNNDTGNNYASLMFYANTSTFASAKYNSKAAIYLAYFAAMNSTNQYMGKCEIGNYASTSMNKQVSFTNNSPAGTSYKGVEYGSGVWLSTSAITQITLTAYTTSFIVDSVFTLYGIKAA